MSDRPLHGVDAAQEQQKDLLLRDIRTPWQKFAAALLSREGFLACCAVLLVLNILFPAFWPCYFIALLIIFLLRASGCKRNTLPMRLPNVHPGLDYGDMSPGGGYNRAQGMFYLGNDSQRQELWIGKNDLLTHMLLLGTTGAGKTETLVSLAYNFLAVGSGFMIIDPKAAPKLAAQIYTMCRIMGRDDDFLILNYMADALGQETMRTKGHQRAPSRESNTQNPFAIGTANQLSQLLFALMPGEDGQNSVFSGNAQTLASGLMFALVELRDKGEHQLSIDVIRHYLMNITAIDELARRNDLSDISTNAIRAALSNVGWRYDSDSKKQGKNFDEQYSYARAYFGRALSLLVDNYGRIFKTSHGEVDTVDIIVSRRIFLGLIPSMDKDPKELKSLGQICLAGVRAASAVGLGNKVQGTLADVLGTLPTDARNPLGIIVDEYAAIETPGFEILLTQGRGLGISVIVASQDFAGIRRASEAAAEQIVSNCKVKIFMTSEDPRQTYDLVKALAGEATVLKTSGFSVDKQRGGVDYIDNQVVNADRVSRVDFRDLQRQIEGEMHAVFKGNLIRGKTFYAAPPLAMEQRVALSYLLKLQDPDIKMLRAKLGDIRDLKNTLVELVRAESTAAVPIDLGRLGYACEVFLHFSQSKRYPMMEVAVAALLHYMQASDGAALQASGTVEVPASGVASSQDTTPAPLVLFEADDPFAEDPFGDVQPLASTTADTSQGAGQSDTLIAPRVQELLSDIEIALTGTSSPKAIAALGDALHQSVRNCYAPPLPESSEHVSETVTSNLLKIIDELNWKS